MIMSRNRAIVFLALVVTVLLAVPAAQAQGDHEGWRFRAFGGVVGRFVESDNVTFTDPVYGLSATEAGGTGFGFGVGVERRFTRLFGLDLAVGFADFDVEFTQSLTTDVVTESLDVTPIWLAANFHVVNTDKVDFWLGPQIAYVNWSGPLSFDVPGEGTFVAETESEFPGLGIVLGLDLWLSDKNGINFAFRFVDADASEDLPVDPTFVTVGYTRKF